MFWRSLFLSVLSVVSLAIVACFLVIPLIYGREWIGGTWFTLLLCLYIVVWFVMQAILCSIWREFPVTSFCMLDAVESEEDVIYQSPEM
jgi:hypothetical protein